MIGCPEYTLSLPPTCPTNRDHLILRWSRKIGQVAKVYSV